MGVVWFRFLSELRARWRSWLGLGLIVGLAGAVVLAALAGARRTDSAYDRFLRETAPSDVQVLATPFPVDFEAIRRLPEVAQTAMFKYVLMSATAPGDPFEIQYSPFYSVDGELWERIDRPKVLEGRRPDPTQPDEAAITPHVARQLGLSVGSTLTMRSITVEQAGDLFSLNGAEIVPAGPSVALKIVGIELAPGEFVTYESDNVSAIHMTPAFGARYGDTLATVDALAVRLRQGGQDVPSFKAGVERITGGAPAQFVSQNEDASRVRRSIHLQAVALQLFAALAGVASLLILGQALVRQTSLAAADYPTLAALGMTTGQRWAGAMLRSAVTASVGAFVAVSVAVLASPLMPLGLARWAEPDPGMTFDALVLPLGAAAIVLLAMLSTAWPVWLLARSRSLGRPRASAPSRPSAIVGLLARVGTPVPMVAGVSMAVEPGYGPSAVPIRSTLVGTTFSVAALVVAATFGASLDHLFTTPRLYGWNWDGLVQNVYGGDIADSVGRVLTRHEVVEEFAAVSLAQLDVNGTRVQALGFEPVQGVVLPPIVGGRAPLQPNEVVLGGRTLRSIDRDIGETVRVVVGDQRLTMRIVGRGVFPVLGGPAGGLGEGALLRYEDLTRLLPEAPRNVFPLRFGPGVDAGRALGDIHQDFEQLVDVDAAEAPTDVADFGRVDQMPLILAALLGFIAATALPHTLVTAVRRRRRDLAILKTLGLVTGQVRATVAWQATFLTAFALAVGIPLGIVAGIWAWRAFADGLGIVPEPIVPTLILLVTVPAAFAVANMIAAFPGRIAARLRPASVFRSE